MPRSEEVFSRQGAADQLVGWLEAVPTGLRPDAPGAASRWDWFVHNVARARVNPGTLFRAKQCSQPQPTSTSSWTALKYAIRIVRGLAVSDSRIRSSTADNVCAPKGLNNRKSGLGCRKNSYRSSLA